MSNDTYLHQKSLIIARTTSSKDEGSVKTFSKRLFYLTGKELDLIAEKRQNDALWGSFWRWRRYSAREDHGVAIDSNYIAGGIDLESLLVRAGLNKKERNGNFIFSAESYKAIVDHPLGKRYRFGKNGEKQEVAAMLALKSIRIDNNSESFFACNALSYPRLFFGQSAKSEVNQCSFVHNLRKIEPVGITPAVKIYKNGLMWTSYSLADLVLKGGRSAPFNMDGNWHICIGVDLFQILCEIFSAPEGFCDVITEYGKIIRIDDIAEGKYMLAWYSYMDKNGLGVKNSTELMLYGHNMAIGGLMALCVSKVTGIKTILPLKKPWTEGDNICNSEFYCALDMGFKREYYYFSRNELDTFYYKSEETYPYDDHGVKKRVICRGVLLTDIIGSLCDINGNNLNIGDEYHVQYLEEDAYHANTPTYIDSLTVLYGMNRAIYVLSKKETFEFPDKLHADETDFTPPEKPVIYRRTSSANEAVIKGIMGILLRKDPEAITTLTCSIRLTDEDGRLIQTRLLKGILPGMSLGIKAPELARYSVLYPVAMSTTFEHSADVNFVYRELPFVVLENNGFSVIFYVSEYADAVAVIPPSLEYTEALLTSGEAAVVSDDSKIIEEPVRHLYIDRRSSTENSVPYGYENFLLYQYRGWMLRSLLEWCNIECTDCIVLPADGSITRITEIDDCFVAFARTESKGVPYNTAVHKRKTREYSHPLLVSVYDGKSIAEDVRRIISE